VLGQKLIAMLIMVIPAAIAVYGIKLMRDAFYQTFHPEISFPWGTFILGGMLFLIPVAFIGGFILHHDRKRNRVQPRFMKRDPEEDEED